MECMALVSRGIEDVACMEIAEITGAKCRQEEGCALFSAKKIEDLFRISYSAQSISCAILLLSSFEFKTFDNIPDKIKKVSIPSKPKIKKFVVKCQREGSHDFSSTDVEKELIKHIEKKLDAKHDFREFELVFFCYICSNKFYFGIDFAGFELQKRQYKIYAQSSSLRCTIAYALARLSGFKKGESLLDPFAGDGIILIESALYSSGISPNLYNKDKFLFTRLKDFPKSKKLLENLDKNPSARSKIIGFDSAFRHIDYTRKNAKIAGVHDLVELSRVEMEWLDVKFRGKSIDRIVTKLPSSIKAANGKLLNEFFYQSEFVLKDKGTIALITHYPDMAREAASKKGFKILEERKVRSGQQELWIMVLNKAQLIGNILIY